MTAGSAARPRLLVTGFSSFPGTPENPTEALIHALQACSDDLARFGDVHCETLAVEYRPLPQKLEELGRAFDPDIALHFGVSGRATSFAVETLARNRVCILRADNTGHVPVDEMILAKGAEFASSLPVKAIMAALAARGLPVSLSDDAGDYLCNYLFYLSGGGHHPPFKPAMAGFIHVPPFGAALDGGGRRFDLRTLMEGTLAIIATCCEAWHEAPSPAQGAHLDAAKLFPSAFDVGGS